RESGPTPERVLARERRVRTCDLLLCVRSRWGGHKTRARALSFLCMNRDVHLPRIERRRSKLHGWGVFTLQPINKNTRIVTYDGELISHKQSLRRETKYLKRGEIWIFTVNRRWVRDAQVGGNIARFINHACRPNCYSQIIGHDIWIRAGR